jgi:hypothetical protein
MTRHEWDTDEYRTACYERALTRTAREIRARALNNANTPEHTEKLAKSVLTAAAHAGMDRRAAARDWANLVRTPQADDQELATLAAIWDALQPKPDTISWYNKWFCENTMDMGMPYTIDYYRNCIAQYNEWMAEDLGSEEAHLAMMKEQYNQILRDCCDQCNVYVEAARLAGVRMFTDDVPDTEHAKHHMQTLIAAVRAHADKQYNDTDSGWHIVAEEWNDTDLAQRIGAIATPEEAIAHIGRIVREEFAIWQQG